MSNPKNRLPSHMAQSPSPSPARGGIEKPPPKSSWWAKLVGRRPSKRKREPIDDVDVPENLTQEYWDEKDLEEQLLKRRKQLHQQQNPWWGPGNWLGRMEHNAILRNSAQAQKDADKIAADIAAEIAWKAQRPNWRADAERNANDLKALDKEALLEEYRKYQSTGGGFLGVLPLERWIELMYNPQQQQLPNMTVPGVDKRNTAEENFRLYGGPLELGRLHDPRDANRMGGKSKRILKSKSRSNKGKKTHRSTRSRSTCRRSTCRRSTCRR
jgi:hypothetical protein